MRKILLLLLTTTVMGTTKTSAQCCGKNIDFMTWLYESCTASNKEFQDLANNLPDDMACYAKVGKVFYLAFKDSRGQRHLVFASEGEYDTFQATAFEDSSSNKIFSAIFMLGGSDQDFKLLSYDEPGEYVRPSAPFKNFKEYWQKYFLSKEVSTHQ